MGVYFNPSNASFRQARNSRIYVDKTGLIEQLNMRLSTEDKCLAVSHARRFGKSHAAGMIDAYYSLGCDSRELFDDTKIAGNADYGKYMNKYNVIHLDIASVWDFHKEDLVESIKERVCKDFKKEYGDSLNYSEDLYLLIQDIYCKTNTPFVLLSMSGIVLSETATIRNLYTNICSSFTRYSNQRSQNHFWHWHILPEFCQLKRLGMSRH